MKTEIQLQTTTIRNIERHGSTLSDNTNVDVLNFTKEEILKMTDAEIKSKILPSIWYEKVLNAEWYLILLKLFLKKKLKNKISKLFLKLM